MLFYNGKECVPAEGMFKRIIIFDRVMTNDKTFKVRNVVISDKDIDDFISSLGPGQYFYGCIDDEFYHLFFCVNGFDGSEEDIITYCPLLASEQGMFANAYKLNPETGVMELVLSCVDPMELCVTDDDKNFIVEENNIFMFKSVDDKEILKNIYGRRSKSGFYVTQYDDAGEMVIVPIETFQPVYEKCYKIFNTIKKMK